MIVTLKILLTTTMMTTCMTTDTNQLYLVMKITRIFTRLPVIIINSKFITYIGRYNIVNNFFKFHHSVIY